MKKIIKLAIIIASFIFCIILFGGYLLKSNSVSYDNLSFNLKNLSLIVDGVKFEKNSITKCEKIEIIAKSIFPLSFNATFENVQNEKYNAHSNLITLHYEKKTYTINSHEIKIADSIKLNDLELVQLQDEHLKNVIIGKFNIKNEIDLKPIFDKYGISKHFKILDSRLMLKFNDKIEFNIKNAEMPDILIRTTNVSVDKMLFSKTNLSIKALTNNNYITKFEGLISENEYFTLDGSISEFKPLSGNFKLKTQNMNFINKNITKLISNNKLMKSIGSFFNFKSENIFNTFNIKFSNGKIDIGI